MTVPTGTIIRASARFYGYHDQDLMNVWNFACNFTADQDENDVFDAIDTRLQAVYNDWDDYISDEIETNDLKVDGVDFIGGEWVTVQNIAYGPWGAGFTPTKADDLLPAGCAAVGFLLTALGKHQGRKFFGGFTEDSCSASGAINSNAFLAIGGGLLDMTTEIVISSGNVMYPCVLDYTYGIYRVIEKVAVNIQWGYQRRRRPGVGS